MRLIMIKALWGMTGTPAEMLARAAGAGYQGVEFWPGQFTLSVSEWSALLDAHGLAAIVGALVEQREQLEPTLTELARHRPLLINLHSGRDSMRRDEGHAFFEEALRLEAAISVPVAHETHRGRLFYTPWDTADYLRVHPALKINADYSHWVNVCERLPDDQAEALALANARALRIHGRVGYEEGPQVPDPSASEYAHAVAWHERQWQQIRDHHTQAGAEQLTFTPEYGPPPYLHTLPHTNVPVADLWDVCLWGAERARTLLG